MGNPSQSYGASLAEVAIWDRSHNVTCHPTQVNVPRHNSSRPGQYSIYLPRKDRKLSRPRQLDSGPTGNRTHDRLSPTP